MHLQIGINWGLLIRHGLQNQVTCQEIESEEADGCYFASYGRSMRCGTPWGATQISRALTRGAEAEGMKLGIIIFSGWILTLIDCALMTMMRDRHKLYILPGWL